MKNNKIHLLMLLICAFLWGTTFAAQSIGAGYVGAYTYLAGRSYIAVVLLIPIAFLVDKINAARQWPDKRPKNKAELNYLIRAGVICGTCLCFASAAQQYGLAFTSTAKSSFLTALYVVLVPICSIFLKKQPPVQIWFCVLISLIGMVLLCMGKNLIAGTPLTVERGDAFEILCAVLFTLQVLNVAYYAPNVDAVRLSIVQFAVVAVESTVFAVMIEEISADNIIAALPAIVYAGVFSSGIAYTLQIIGQDGVNPTVATLIMSLESVFGALSGWAVLGESMLPIELAGGALMFAAIVLAQLPIAELIKRCKSGAQR